ncbi:hypothetical protein [Allorhizocola rhizosphaerae]|uniref:hypothetical protein n=1 Tax=Allorhizocola rhizosphaerae TaxID=1872709 RepID=UPI000E3C98AA|nr:hypothetical protein [Allorhizocola rhizosphaerae]
MGTALCSDNLHGLVGLHSKTAIAPSEETKTGWSKARSWAGVAPPRVGREREVQSGRIVGRVHATRCATPNLRSISSAIRRHNARNETCRRFDSVSSPSLAAWLSTSETTWDKRAVERVLALM